MKVQVLQESLQKALSSVSKVVSTKPNLPILANIFMKAEGEILLLAGTDLDVGIKLTIKAKVEESGVVSVPARLFVDFISSLSPSSVFLETNDLVLKVKSDAHTSSFNCMNADDFPPFPEKGTGLQFEVPAASFKKALTKTLFSSSTDISRQVLTGALFEFKKKETNIVTTDGFRLSLQKLALQQEADKLIIPARGLQELLRIGEIEKSEENEEEPKDKKKKIVVNLTENNNQVIIEDTNVEIFLRLLEGQFPDYKKIIPSEFVSTVNINKDELSKAVKVASIFARDNANIVHLTVNAQEGTVAVSAQAREMGEGASVLPGNIEGESLNISFNARFLNEILTTLTTEMIVLQFSGNLKPVKITEEDNETFFHVLMPVRTGN